MDHLHSIMSGSVCVTQVPITFKFQCFIPRRSVLWGECCCVSLNGNLVSPAELSGARGQAAGGLLPGLSWSTARGREAYFRSYN